MLNKFKLYLPNSLKPLINLLLARLRKPELQYLELHLTDHCNLDCKGCGHYSPLAKPKYADVRQYEIDMQRLSQLFRNIRKVRLMGGEPLLHQDPASFILITRTAFPEAQIHFVTNGILLKKVAALFWDACRTTNTIIDLSVYPPLASRIEELRSLCAKEHVTLSVANNAETFFAFHNFKGNSDKQKAFDRCRSKYYCPFLQEGRIYTCGVPALVHNLNKSFGYQIATDGGINIHERGISGRAILRQLSKPIETCRWCSDEFVPFSWAESNKLASEWDADEYKSL